MKKCSQIYLEHRHTVQLINTWTESWKHINFYWMQSEHLASQTYNKTVFFHEIDLWLLWDTIGRLISYFQNPQKNLTSDDLDGIISRSRKWKWPVSSCWLLLGPWCLDTKMFTISQLTKVHLDLWRWFMGHVKVKHKFDIGLTSRGYFKVTNVKIACGVSWKSCLPSGT